MNIDINMHVIDARRVTWLATVGLGVELVL